MRMGVSPEQLQEAMGEQVLAPRLVSTALREHREGEEAGRGPRAYVDLTRDGAPAAGRQRGRRAAKR